MKDIDFYLAEGDEVEPEEECKDITCYFHGGTGQGCMTSGRCIYEQDDDN